MSLHNLISLPPLENIKSKPPTEQKSEGALIWNSGRGFEKASRRKSWCDAHNPCRFCKDYVLGGTLRQACLVRPKSLKKPRKGKKKKIEEEEQAHSALMKLNETSSIVTPFKQILKDESWNKTLIRSQTSFSNLTGESSSPFSSVTSSTLPPLTESFPNFTFISLNSYMGPQLPPLVSSNSSFVINPLQYKLKNSDLHFSPKPQLTTIPSGLSSKPIPISNVSKAIKKLNRDQKGHKLKPKSILKNPTLPSLSKEVSFGTRTFETQALPLPQYSYRPESMHKDREEEACFSLMLLAKST